MKKEVKRKILFTVGLVIFIDNLGGGMLMPLLPSLFMDGSIGLLGESSPELKSFYFGLSYLLFPVVAMFSNPYLGYLSDFKGRRFVILNGMIGFLLSNGIAIVSIVTRNLWMFLAARVLLGLFSGSYTAASAALMDVSANEKEKVRNIKLVTLITILGFILGPSLSAWVPSKAQGLTLAIPFLIVFVLSALNLFLIWKFFPKTELHNNVTLKHQEVPNVFKMLRTSFVFAVSTPMVFYLGLEYLAFQLGYQFYFQTLAMNLQQVFGFSVSMTGSFFFLMGICYMIGMYGVHAALDRYWSFKATTQISIVASSIMIALLAFLSLSGYGDQFNPGALWLINIAFFLITPIAAINLFKQLMAVRVENQGLIVGVAGQINSVALILSASLIAVLHSRLGRFEYFITVASFLAVLGMRVVSKIHKSNGSKI